MNLREAKTLTLDLMGRHGLIVTGWRFKFDRAVKRLGLTNYRYKTISLSRQLTVLNDLPQVQNTILHEIAHALVGSMNGHNDVWRSKAVSIGCNGQRCTNSIMRVTPKYKVRCGVCSASWDYHRRPRNLATSWHSSCGRISKGKLILQGGN